MLRHKKFLIVEDEPLIAAHLKTILASFECNNIAIAYDTADALTALAVFKPDMVLLDINLSNKPDGIDIASHINSNIKVPFIFVTAYSDAKTLSNAITQHPAAYITKPFKQADILAAIQLVFIKNPQLSKEYFNFKDGAEWVRLQTTTITHIESSGNYIIIYTIDKKYTLRNSLAWALEHLPEATFVKVHRGFIVNTHHIKELTIQHIKVSNTTIPISRQYKDCLLEKLHLANRK